jgi:hypothetical protein
MRWRGWGSFGEKCLQFVYNSRPPAPAKPPAVERCSFSFPMSYCDPLTCGDVSCLTACHLRFVSNSCHFFGCPSQTHSDQCHGAHEAVMHRVPLCHVTIGRSCVG